MKAKKAIKKLKKAQLSLSNVVDQWNDLGSEARDLLNAAGQSVSRALGLIDSGAPAAVAGKPPGSAEQGGGRSIKGRRKSTFSDERKRKLSRAAKRRWAAAKRRGAKTLAG